MRFKANAKINLALDVLGTRPNGYHDVKMVMQSVNLSDYLDIIPNDENRIIINCDNNEIQCDESNLIYRAAKAIMEKTGAFHGVSITLEKNIPIAAGMAGGSTDAAATLVGINRVFELGLTDRELQEIGVTLGADIPYCIVGGTYLSEGIGEILTKIKDAPNAYLVIAKPDINVSTKFVYDNLVLDEQTVHPDVDKMLAAIDASSLSEVSASLGNLLASVTEHAHPVILEMKHILLENGAMGALMSGSGPTVFGIFDNEATAQSALQCLHSKISFKNGFVTTFANSGIIQE